MVRKAIGVHEDNCDSFYAISLGRHQISAHGRDIRFPFERSVGAHAFINFSHALVEHVGLDDLPGEYIWPRLIADLEAIAESLGDQQERAFALRSSRAFVATVVPIFTAPTQPAGIAVPALRPSKSR